MLKEGGSSFVEVLGRGPLFNEGKAIVSPAANALEEVHFRSRDTHVEAERQLLAELAQDIHNLSRVPTSGQVSSDSTYCLRGIGTTESVGLPQGLAEGRSLEPPVLKEVQRILEEIGESIEEGKAVDAKARARLAHLDKELGQELNTVRGWYWGNFCVSAYQTDLLLELVGLQCFGRNCPGPAFQKSYVTS